MSLFMQNLIARHREGGAGFDSVAVPLVRPRPKARFESEPGRGVSTWGSARTDFDQVKEFTSVEEYRQGDSSPSPPAHEPDDHFYLSRPVRQTEPTAGDTQQRTLPVMQGEQETVPLDGQPPDPMSLSEQRMTALESRISDSGRHQPKKRPALTETGRQATRAMSSVSESNLRVQEVQEILHRLNAERPQRQDTDVQPILYPEQKLPLSEAATRSDDSGSMPRIEAQSAFSTTAEQTTRDRSSADAFNQRIQEILHRLHAEQPQQNTPEKEPVGTLNSSVLSETDSSVSDAPSGERSVLQSGLLTEPPVSLAQQSYKEGLSTNHPKQEPETLQAGLLQTPDWLKEMQLDLHKLRQSDNGQSQSEPVINVSIGRVEVRATQTPSGNKPKIRQRPSGVMSLDQYLKQRENRG